MNLKLAKQYCGNSKMNGISLFGHQAARHIAIFVWIVLGLLSSLAIGPQSAFAAWSLDGLKRDLGPDAEACQGFADTSTIHPKTNGESDLHHSDAWRCYYQTVRTSTDGVKYDLNFLEFDADGKFRHQAQFDQLKKQISSGSHLVVVYVHGWRHDAGQDDSDVKKFRTMLTYSAQFLRQRQTNGNYPEMKVTGIYVGWSGRSRVDCAWSICDLLVVPSLYSRKSKSDQLGIPVVNALVSLEKILRSHSSGAESRMLVTGHSLGGNMLIRGIKDLGRVESVINNHKHGQPVLPVLGDLAILFNPASEAENWVHIQRLVRDKMNLTDPNERFGLTNDKAIINHSRFPFTQKPILISLTSACDWPDFVTKNDANKDLLTRKIDCDKATGRLFPLFRTSTLKLDKISKTAIGHLIPTDACVKYIDIGNGKGRCKLPKGHKLFSFGATHELEVQVTRKNKMDRSTTYMNAIKPEKAVCLPGNGWLVASKSLMRSEGGSPDSNYVGWDTGYLDDPSKAKWKQARAWVNRDMGINVQYRHQIFRGFGVHGRAAKYNITFAHDPFWNVRALDTAVKSHGGFHSYPVWCSIHQILFDEISSD